MRIARGFAATALLLLNACAAATGPGWSREIGYLVVDDPHLPTLQLPDSVAAGIDFTAVVTTYGSSSCTRAADVEIELGEREARLVPYDFMPPPGTPCTRDLRGFPREVVLRFAAPGDAVVRVVGRTFRGDTVSVRRTVVVRPR
jgi:hypothetical protein